MNIRFTTMMLAVGCLLLPGAATRLHAQTANDQGGKSPPISTDEALDRALVEVRIAETRGPDAQKAFLRAGQFVEYVLAQDRYNRRALYYKARLLILGNRGPEALGTLQRWTDSPQGQNDWEAHLLLGKLYEAGGFHKLAKPSLHKALSLNPLNPQICAALTRCEMNMLNYQAAVQHARETVRMLGSSASPADYALLSETLLLNKQLDEADGQARVAIDAAGDLLRSEGSSVPSLELLGRCLALAIKVKQAKLEGNPETGALCLEVSRLIQKQTEAASLVKTHEALGWSLRGLDSSGDSAPVTLFLDAITLQVRLGRTDEARELAERMLQAHPDSAEARQAYRSVAPLPATDPEAAE